MNAIEWVDDNMDKDNTPGHQVARRAPTSHRAPTHTSLGVLAHVA